MTSVKPAIPPYPELDRKHRLAKTAKRCFKSHARARFCKLRERLGRPHGRAQLPSLVQLGQTGVNYLQASAAKPSDSFPGLTAIVTGASPRTAGVYYDVSYDRALSPPAKTTPFGIPGGANLCPGTRGTQVGYEEELDFDNTKLDGAGGINPDYLPRDPNDGCAPVYPHSFLLVNTIFEVIRAAGGYTA